MIAQAQTEKPPLVERAGSSQNVTEALSRSKSIGINPSYRTLTRQKKEDHSREKPNGHWRHGSIDDAQARHRSSLDENRIQELEEEEKISGGSQDGEKE